MEIYVVQPNDTIDIIAGYYDIPVETLIYANQLSYPYALAIGQALLIPTDSTVEATKTVITNGFAYPFINRSVLESTLPFLTNISIFSYGFTEEGELVYPNLDDTWMIELAKEQNVNPILTLTPIDASGTFNNQRIHALVQSETAKQNLFNNLLATMNQKGFKGVDVDFEYILAEDRDYFTNFVAELTDFMNEQGYEVSVDLAPKTSADQPGLLYGGKDYGGLGAAANAVLLMTYEWGYTYSEPMAVAPINKVRQVVDYAITEIPIEKINLGIPNYGYDWPLPYEKGVTKATVIGNIQAAQRAAEYGAIILFDEVAQTPHYNYTDFDGVEHEVWFEDVRSIKAKFDLVQEYNLRGMGYWQLMRLFRANWLLLSDMFDISKTIL